MNLRTRVACGCSRAPYAAVLAARSSRFPIARSRLFPHSRFAIPDSRRSGGFTLLEILLALVLMAMVMLGVWGALAGAARVSHATDAVMSAGESVRTAQQFLRRYLATADPQPFIEGSGGPARVFVGDPTAMRYVARLPMQSGHAGLYVQTLSLDARQSGELVLSLTYAPYAAGGPATAKPVRHVLLADVRQGRFEYLGEAAPGGTPAWRDSWQSAGGLPLAVRIHIDPAWRARVPFPDMVIRLHGGGGPGAAGGDVP